MHTISPMIFQPVRVLLTAACLLALPFHAPAPQVYRPGEGWVYEPAGGSSDFPREVVLRPEVVAYDLEVSNQNFGKTNQPFLKEPELG